ncbi:MAG: DUF2586 family protein [Paludibacter sp.]|nr:DUF2586 family protein [Paludibacter sp.]
MSLRGITITEGAFGANTATDSREFGLVAGGVAVAGKFALGDVLVLKRPSDAIAYGITAGYDAENAVQVFRHVSEFYRMAGEGKTLVVAVVAQAKTPSEMVDQAKALVLDRDAISDMAFAFNPDVAYEETLLNGMNDDVFAGIQALQVFADWADANDRPLHCILEGRGISDTLSSLTDLRALTVGEADLSAHKVTLVCGQDWNYADGLTALGKKFADVGTFLGCVAAQNWNQNPGQVDGMNLSNAALNIWTVGGLSNHKKYSEVYADLETMNDKGYVFPIKYTGLSGYWWNDGHTCAPVINDAAGNLNQHTIYYSHTMDMAKRALRTAYLYDVKKVVDLEGGKLPSGMIGYYNAVGNDAFEYLANKGLISGGSASTDADSDLLVEKKLNVSFKVQPTGCVNEIVGTINLSSN